MRLLPSRLLSSEISLVKASWAQLGTWGRYTFVKQLAGAGSKIAAGQWLEHSRVLRHFNFIFTMTSVSILTQCWFIRPLTGGPSRHLRGNSWLDPSLPPKATLLPKATQLPRAHGHSRPCRKGSGATFSSPELPAPLGAFSGNTALTTAPHFSLPGDMQLGGECREPTDCHRG